MKQTTKKTNASTTNERQVAAQSSNGPNWRADFERFVTTENVLTH